MPGIPSHGTKLEEDAVSSSLTKAQRFSQVLGNSPQSTTVPTIVTTPTTPNYDNAINNSQQASYPTHINYQETPYLEIPQHTAVFLSMEETAEVSTFLDTYRGTVGGMSDPQEIGHLEDRLPSWMYDWIVEQKPPSRDPAKMSFILQPAEGSNLPELPNNTSRLSANRMLRVRKLLAYVVDKLDLNPPGVIKPDMKHARTASAQTIANTQFNLQMQAAQELGWTRDKPEVWLEMLCHDKVCMQYGLVCYKHLTHLMIS